MTDQIERAQQMLREAAEAEPDDPALTERELEDAAVLGFSPEYYLALKQVRNINDWHRARQRYGDPKVALTD